MRYVAPKQQILAHPVGRMMTANGGGVEARAGSRALTIVVPAYNEQSLIATALDAVLRTAQRRLDAYEIIVVDDGSRDATGRIADDFARQHDGVRVVHQETNQGVGAAYLVGLAQARFDFITVVPGDNAFSESALNAVFSAVGTAPLVVSYRDNMEVRKPLRRLLSVICTMLMRIVSGRTIRDAHSMFIFPVAIARRYTIQPGYGYHIESLGRLLVDCPSFVEVPAMLNPRPDDNSGVMRTRVIWLLGTTVLRLAVWRVGTLIRRPQFKPAAAEKAGR
jgi:glycosyltransferase involved in cell wall biosynthesis